MNRHFTEEGIQMASKYMKMCHQRSKKIRRVHIRSTLWLYYTPLQWLKYTIPIILVRLWTLEELELSHTADGSRNWYNYFGRLFQQHLQRWTNHIILFSNYPPRYMTSRMHTYVHPKTYKLWEPTQICRVDIKIILQWKYLSNERCRNLNLNFLYLTKSQPPQNIAATQLSWKQTTRSH